MGAWSLGTSCVAFAGSDNNNLEEKLRTRARALQGRRQDEQEVLLASQRPHSQGIQAAARPRWSESRSRSKGRVGIVGPCRGRARPRCSTAILDRATSGEVSEASPSEASPQRAERERTQIGVFQGFNLVPVFNISSSSPSSSPRPKRRAGPKHTIARATRGYVSPSLRSAASRPSSRAVSTSAWPSLTPLVLKSPKSFLADEPTANIRRLSFIELMSTETTFVPLDPQRPSTHPRPMRDGSGTRIRGLPWPPWGSRPRLLQPEEVKVVQVTGIEDQGDWFPHPSPGPMASPDWAFSPILYADYTLRLPDSLGSLGQASHARHGFNIADTRRGSSLGQGSRRALAFGRRVLNDWKNRQPVGCHKNNCTLGSDRSAQVEL